MSKALTLRAGTPTALVRYVANQLCGLFPDQSIIRDEEALHACMNNTLERLRPILAAVRIFDPHSFDHFHALQYASFLYLLSVEADKNGQRVLADRLFYLNRTLNAIDLYHQVTLGEVFFLSHGLGSVLGNAHYATDLVVFHQVTVGRIGDNRPTIGRGVVLYPGCNISGGSVVGDGCVISAQVQIHNKIIPDHSLVTQGRDGVIISPLEKSYLALYLRV